MHPARVAWIDTARGLCGLAVLLHHALAIAVGHGATSPALTVLDDALSPLRMPLLMALSGSVMVRALDRPLPEFLRRRVQTTVWPYVLWSVVTLAATGALVPAALVRIATVAPTYLWFLQFLAVFALIGWLLRRLGVPAVAVGLLCLALTAIVPETHRADRFVYLLGFFLIGTALPALLPRLRPTRRVRWWIGAPLSLLAVVGVLVAGSGTPVRYQAHWAPLVLAAVLAVFLLAPTVPTVLTAPIVPTRGSGPLAHLGRNAVVLYVTHMSVLVVVAPTFVRLAPTAPGPVVVLVSAAAALAVAALFILLRRVRLVDLLFALPATPLRARRRGVTRRRDRPRRERMDGPWTGRRLPRTPCRPPWSPEPNSARWGSLPSPEPGAPATTPVPATSRASASSGSAAAGSPPSASPTRPGGS